MKEGDNNWEGMGRVPCCEKDNVKRGQWTPEEDNKLSSYIAQHGTRNWRLIPKNAGPSSIMLSIIYMFNSN